jgi:hypothetical protein
MWQRKASRAVKEAAAFGDMAAEVKMIQAERQKRGAPAAAAAKPKHVDLEIDFELKCATCGDEWEKAGDEHDPRVLRLCGMCLEVGVCSERCAALHFRTQLCIKGCQKPGVAARRVVWRETMRRRGLPQYETPLEKAEKAKAERKQKRAAAAAAVVGAPPAAAAASVGARRKANAESGGGPLKKQRASPPLVHAAARERSPSPPRAAAAAATAATTSANSQREIFTIQIGQIDHQTNDYFAISDLSEGSFRSEKDALCAALRYIAFDWQSDRTEPDSIPLPGSVRSDSVHQALTQFIAQLDEPYPSGTDQKKESEIDDARLDDLTAKLEASNETDLRFWLAKVSLQPSGKPWLAVTKNTLH